MAVEYFTPEEMGWVSKGGGIWEKPDGTLHMFPPNVPQLVVRFEPEEEFNYERQSVEEPKHKRPGEPA